MRLYIENIFKKSVILDINQCQIQNSKSEFLRTLVTSTCKRRENEYCERTKS